MDDRSPRWRSRPPKGPRRKVIVANNDGAYDEQKGKFIGGAERARRNARKRQRANGGGCDFGPNQKKNYHSNSQTHQLAGGRRNVARIPKIAKPMNRFFASLFLCSVEDIVNSDDNDASRTHVMSEICGRLGLPMPAQIPAASIDSHHFYSTRASLVMEEARHIIADALRKHQPSDPHGRRHKDVPSTLNLRLVSVEEKEKLGALIFTFERETPGDTFTPQELHDMRPGCCFELIVEDKLVGTTESATDDILLKSESVLANVVPTADRQSVERQLSLMVHQKLKVDEEAAGQELWQVRPLTTLISEARQFEACTRAPNVAFLPKLLGWKDASHIRFDDSDDDSNSNSSGSDEDVEDAEKPASEETEIAKKFHQLNIILPRLNPTQERAASAYLSSPASTLTLIQGPPGTGKTTFTVSCIVRCLYEQQSGRRLLVTAPTNKAITVLASRFLSALNGDDSFKIVMIGVEDKLIEDKVGRASNNYRRDDGDDALVLPSTLRDIFVYSWVDTTIDQFLAIEQGLRSNRKNIEVVATKARNLRKKLRSGIPSTYRTSEAAASLDALIHTLEQTDDFHDMVIGISNVISDLREMDQSVVTKELLATADVIFSTLSTAGIAAMKQTRSVTDLIVDEAAAATEPEILIPLHLRPDRLLAVGDPMQLPATIMSRNAARLGLDRSLHQRLMYECGKEHIMLDTQYRMRPDIALYPSKQFYDGKLMNGGNVRNSTYGRESDLLFGGKPFVFFQINGTERQSASGSYCNHQEGLFVVEYLKLLRAAANKKSTSSSTGKTNWCSPDKVRVITFYQAQVCLIQKLLHKNGFGTVLVSTVDSCQGCEADIVILSFVRCNKKRGSIKHTAGFLCDERRLNVALTRAKYQLVCIGDANGTLSASDDSVLSKLVHEARSRKCIKSLED